MSPKDLIFLISSLLLVAMCSINYSLIYPFFADYCKLRGVMIKQYSIVIGVGDSAYALGFLVFPIVCKKRLRLIYLAFIFLINFYKLFCKFEVHKV